MSQNSKFNCLKHGNMGMMTRAVYSFSPWFGCIFVDEHGCNSLENYPNT